MHTSIRHNGATSGARGALMHNPRDLVLDLIRDNPEASRGDLFEKFRDLLQENSDEYRRAVDWYFFTHMHAQISDPRPTNAHSRTRTPRQRAERKSRIAQVVESIKQVVMLDLIMTNGKAMRDCTGAEMAKFGNRYQRIAEKVGKTKTVGAVLSEDQVKAIMK